jgi:hypothetical protein
MWIAQTKSTDFAFINWMMPANCVVAKNNPQLNKGNRINESYMAIFLAEIFVLEIDNGDGRPTEF